MTTRKIDASFRDPAGFIFKKNDTFYRQINLKGRDDYELFVTSGLFQKLVEKQLLINHQEVENVLPDAYKTILPEQLSFVSYPYEWSFSQFKDAALTTLRIQNIALNYGMVLKDASAYNIQFIDNKAVFIDTLSFAKYEEGKPWIAYKQFCQHFLAPLALMRYKDVRMSKLMTSFIDGIPLDLASKLLPFRSKFSFAINSHIHWHAKSQIKHSDETINREKKVKIAKKGLKAIVSNLYQAIQKMKWNIPITEWGDYYNNTNYTSEAFEFKKNLVSDFIQKSGAKNLWDLGANDGTFSKLAADKGIETIAFDIDPVAVEKNYLRGKENKNTHITPLILDLTSPSPAIGWANKERPNLAQRGPADCVMALALIHHLAISNNLPFDFLASYFAQLGSYLIIEFVPKEDSKVQKLLATREDIFPHYNIAYFENAFENFFELIEKTAVLESHRTLYLFKKK